MSRRQQYALQLMRQANGRKGPEIISDHGKEDKTWIKEANRWMNPLGPIHREALKGKQSIGFKS